MVGYVSVNVEELKIKEYREYKRWYCGLCRQMAESGGTLTRLALSYDMVFLYLLLSSLYDEKVTGVWGFCPLHPVRRRLMYETKAGRYVSDMGILLAYYDRKDDWEDEKEFQGFLVSAALKKQAGRAAEAYPEKYRAVKKYLKKLHTLEKSRGSKKAGLDLAAGYTGEMLAEIFVYQKDLWEEPLRRMGFYLGKFIYLMDAWEDIEKDVKNGNYNPFFRIYMEKAGKYHNYYSMDGMKKEKAYQEGKKEFDAYAMRILEKMAAECCRAFEVLPVVEHVEILRNILYSGIWAHHEKVKCRDIEGKKVRYE